MYGRQHVQDIPRPGRPCRATTDENVRKVDGVNWRITIGEVAEELGIGHGSKLQACVFKNKRTVAFLIRSPSCKS
ncbi:hypothetical protein TNCT_129471 [Trichonephila clavata]|uniref:Uncharacterized protein n=1 Tax=Trichonephila clavata TaxID=2740835 RepID=A0A8X6HJ45_TRICU|nr:hypothetical protein TNCT_129471 [Trichonephila clavata]